MRRTTLAVITLAALALALVAVGVATAHIDPTPPKALVGRTTTVAFTVEHGCDGSPTRSLAMRMPAGAHLGEAGPEGGLEDHGQAR